MGRRCREFVVTCCSMDGFLLAVTCLQISGTAIAVLDAAYVDWRMSLLAGHGADHSDHMSTYILKYIALVSLPVASFNIVSLFIRRHTLRNLDIKSMFRMVGVFWTFQFFAVSGLGGRLTIMIIDSESKLEVGDVGALDRTTIIMVTLASLTSFLAFIASVAYIVLIMHNKIETFEKTRYRPLASDADDRNLQERLITK